MEVAEEAAVHEVAAKEHAVAEEVVAEDHAVEKEVAVADHGVEKEVAAEEHAVVDPAEMDHDTLMAVMHMVAHPSYFVVMA